MRYLLAGSLVALAGCGGEKPSAAAPAGGRGGRGFGGPVPVEVTPARSDTVVDAITATALRVQHGLSLLEVLGGWLVPVARAVGLLATDPRVAASLWAAIAACALLMWWMRPRQVRITGGSRHVGILAF